MNSAIQSVTLREWQTLGPDTCEQLRGTFIDDSADCHRVADSLNKSRMLRLTELKDGLEVSAFSHVGRVRVGSLNITVLPETACKFFASVVEVCLRLPPT